MKYFDRTQLTPREAEIQALLSQGLSNEQIAEKLNISGKTVINHLHSIKIRKKGEEYSGRTAMQNVH